MTEKIKEFPGTPLSEEDFREGRILHNFDELQGDFAWDTGIGIGKYLSGLKAGTLFGSLCSTCNKIVVPPRTVCEWCFNPMDEFIPLKDTGTNVFIMKQSLNAKK